MSETYEIIESKGQPAIKCLMCNMISYNSNDIEQAYCGKCNHFHSGIPTNINNINYRKLLVRCMEQWIDMEGGCWDAEDDKTLTEEEANKIKEIFDILYAENDARIRKSELLEDTDERHNRNVR